MNWPLAFVLAVGAAAFAAMVSAFAIFQPLEPEAPKVACIKKRGQWTDGYGRQGWSGTCVFPNK